MAYVSPETKARIAPVVRDIARQYGVKVSIAVRNGSALVLTIHSGKIDFMNNRHSALTAGSVNSAPCTQTDYIQVNTYWYKDHFTGVALEFLDKVITAMNDGNHDNSDAQSDYFDVGWYVNVNIGRWDKPYVLVK